MSMAQKCSAVQCHNRASKNSPLSFHCFPRKNPVLLKKWLHQICRKNKDGTPWYPSEHDKICSSHFTQADFYEGLGRRNLREDAVPKLLPKDKVKLSNHTTMESESTKPLLSQSTAEFYESWRRSSTELAWCEDYLRVRKLPAWDFRFPCVIPQSMDIELLVSTERGPCPLCPFATVDENDPSCIKQHLTTFHLSRNVCYGGWLHLICRQPCHPCAHYHCRCGSTLSDKRIALSHIKSCKRKDLAAEADREVKDEERPQMEDIDGENVSDLFAKIRRVEKIQRRKVKRLRKIKLGENMKWDSDEPESEGEEIEIKAEDKIEETETVSCECKNEEIEIKVEDESESDEMFNVETESEENVDQMDYELASVKPEQQTGRAERPAWAHLLQEPSADFMEGFVATEDSFKELMSIYTDVTKTQFGKVAGQILCQSKRAMDFTGHCIKWHSVSEKGPCIGFFGYPFIVITRPIFACYRRDVKQRPSKHIRKRSAPKERTACPAKVFLKKIVIFKDFGMVCENSKSKKNRISSLVRAKMIEEGADLNVSERIYVKLPHPSEHQGHGFGEEEEQHFSIDERVISRVEEIIKHGVNKIKDIQSLLEIYVTKVLFPDGPAPSLLNRRYYPKVTDLENMKARFRKQYPVFLYIHPDPNQEYSTCEICEHRVITSQPSLLDHHSEMECSGSTSSLHTETTNAVLSIKSEGESEEVRINVGMMSGMDETPVDDTGGAERPAWAHLLQEPSADFMEGFVATEDSFKELMSIYTNVSMVGENSKSKMNRISSLVRAKMIEEGADLNVSERIYVKLPHPSEHQGHGFGEEEEQHFSIDERVISRVEEIIKHGVNKIKDIQSLLEIYVTKVLFPDGPAPSPLNRRYYPTTRNLGNMLTRFQKRYPNFIYVHPNEDSSTCDICEHYTNELQQSYLDCLPNEDVDSPAWTFNI